MKRSGFFFSWSWGFGFACALGLDGNFGVVQTLDQLIQRLQQGFHQRRVIAVERRASRGNAVQRRLRRGHRLGGGINFEQIEIMGHFVDHFGGTGFRWSTKALISACSLSTLVTRGMPRAYWCIASIASGLKTSPPSLPAMRSRSVMYPRVSSSVSGRVFARRVMRWRSWRICG